MEHPWLNVIGFKGICETAPEKVKRATPACPGVEAFLGSLGRRQILPLSDVGGEASLVEAPLPTPAHRKKRCSDCGGEMRWVSRPGLMSRTPNPLHSRDAFPTIRRYASLQMTAPKKKTGVEILNKSKSNDRLPDIPDRRSGL